MRKLLGVLAAGFIAIGAAGQAHAVALQFDGSMALQVATLAPIALPGSGTAVVNGSGGGGHLNSFQLAGGTFGVSGFSLPVSDPAAFPIVGLQATAANGTGNFAGGSVPGGLGGVMPVVGGVKVCLFGSSCGSAVANITVPLSNVGAGGAVAVGAAVNVTVIGAPWTTGTAAVGTVTAMGFAHGPASLTSSTANASGQVQLVTPIFISTNIGASAVLPGFAILNLHFVPEPGTLMLLGSGIAGLVAFGRSRAR
jgi:hypothetical protein